MITLISYFVLLAAVFSFSLVIYLGLRTVLI